VYYAGLAAPGLVLGVLPAAVGLATGDPLATFVGVAGVLLVATDVAPLVAACRRPEAIRASEPAA
jgi:hypothetical protein